MAIEAGRKLLHYRLIEKIGEGGMGVVWKAVDTKLDRQVALKVLPEALSNDSRRLARFQREAKALAALSHPGIVTVYSVEHAEGVHFITMELLPGAPLSTRIPLGGLSLTEFLEIALPLTRAIDAAHQKGVIHRDLKPDNVIVGDDRSLGVLDFGLAQLQETGPKMETLSSTQTAITQRPIVGTLPYMSPEQLQGNEVDHRADIFSLGVMFYEMLAGQRPFRGDTSVELMASILKDSPPAVSESRSGLPLRAARLIARCLEKDPARRFQAAIDLCHELESLHREGGRDELRSIAVLPLVNMSTDPEQEYFCDGITEDIINGLTHVAGIRVVGRTSSFAFKGKQDDMRRIGRKLDVETLLEGSVRKAGERIRVTAQLVDVADGYHLWSERYDRNLTDVFAIQDEIAMSIVKALKIELTEKEKHAIEKVATRNVEAYQFYLRGREFFYKGRLTTLKHALEMFEHAIQKDSGYALAYAGIADCYSWLFMYHEKKKELLDEAKSASERSLELDAELAEAHAARGLAISLDGQYEDAERAFEQALHLNSRLFEAYYFYGRSCRTQGRYEKAAELFARAAEVRLEDYQAASQLAGTLQTMNRAAESEAARRDALERIERHLELNPDDARARYLGAIALLLLGRRERAFEWAQQALAIEPKDSNVLYNLACLYSLGGEIDEALSYLEKSIDAGYASKEWIERDSDLEPIRHHPRYRSLLERLR